MAHRSRNQKVKADVAGSGFLSHIPTAGVIPERWDSLYYRLLHDLGFPELSESEPDRGVLAWLIAMNMVRIAEAYDWTEASNENDRQRKLADREKLPALTKELISLVSAFRRKKDEPQQPEEIDDFQEQLRKAVGADSDRQSD